MLSVLGSSQIRSSQRLRGATTLKIWTAMKSLNQRYDAWALRTSSGIAADLDRKFRSGAERDGKKHLSVWDLLSKKRESGQ